MIHPETCRAAWRDHVPVTARLDRAIMEAVSLAGGVGMTCQDIERATGRNHQATSGNLRHLAERGLVEKAPTTGRTDSGRSAMRWRVNLMGPERTLAPSPRRNLRQEKLDRLVSEIRASAKRIRDTLPPEGSVRLARIDVEAWIDSLERACERAIR